MRYAALAASGRPVLLYGGVPEPKRLAALSRETGLTFTWTPSDTAARTARGVRTQKYVAVIVLEGLTNHIDTAVLRRAARLAGLVYDYGNKGTVVSVLQALARCERKETKAA